MKLLFFMSHPGGARNFESTLRGLAERGHTVHLAFDRTEKRNLRGLTDLADSLVAEHESLTSAKAPRPPKEEEDAWLGCWLRKSLDYMRYLDPEFADAPKLRRRAESWVSGRISKRYESAPLLGRRAMRSSFRMTERSLPPSPTVENFLRKQAPDAVLVTPLLEPGSLQAEYLRVAKRLGIPTCLCVASWDNLTNKGLIHDVPDVVTVWNERQKEEAVRLHHIPADRVVVTGANPYDHWFGWKPSRSREEFAKAAGIDPSRPYVLYAGSSGFIAPAEASFVVEWITELAAHGLDDMQVVARPHPVNPLLDSKGPGADLDAMKRVVVFPRQSTNPTDLGTRQDYFDSLYYSSAVVGVNTSALLEGGIVGRPVMTVLVPRYDETQRGQVHFHHLLTAGGGLLYAAESFAEHAADLKRALAVERPEEVVDPRSERFVAEFIRPHGRDVPATPLLLDAIDSLAQGAKPSRHGQNVASRAVGSALVAVARKSAHDVRVNNRRIKREQDAQLLTKAARRKLHKAQARASAARGPASETKADAKPPKPAKPAKPTEERPGAGTERNRPAKATKPPKAPKPSKPKRDKEPGPALVIESLKLPEALTLDDTLPRTSAAPTPPAVHSVPQGTEPPSVEESSNNA